MAIVKKIQVEVSKVKKHTDSVCTITMTPLSSVPKFSAGQFLHLAIDPYSPSMQWPESRVFSIQSSPTRNHKLVVTFAVKGKFTRRLYDEVAVGDQLWVKMPYGSFTFPQSSFDKVLIAGGTGITPFLSFLTGEVDNKSEQCVQIFYGIRNEKLILFDEELREYKNTLKNFSITYFLETEGALLTQYELGRLDIDKILTKVRSLHNSEYFLSGPPQMITKLTEDLFKHNIRQERVIIDAWE